MTGRFVTRLTDAEIDAAFFEMANDEEYLLEAIELTRSFENSDWEAHKNSGDENPAPSRAATKSD